MTQEHHPKAPQLRGPGLFVIFALIALLGGVGYMVSVGIKKRVSLENRLKQEAEAAVALPVSVIRPDAGAPVEEIALPGSVQPYSDTPIYARTSGYLKAWHFDIGARVQQGQVLAEIEAPEVDKQLQQARAEMATAEANLALAKSTAERWKKLLETNSVSQQETDEKIAAWKVQRTFYDAASSNVKRLEDLKSYQLVRAPFSGVITARNTDIGALVSEGSAQELFHLSAIHRLRVFVNVPQTYASSARPGSVASITMQEAPDRKYFGKLVRTANAIDPYSRTLRTEFDVENPKGELLPGSYVTVHLKLSEKTHALTVPATALLFRAEGLRVAVVRDGLVKLAPITIGRDFGNRVEVVAGLDASDAVISDPPDSLMSGTKVRITAKGAAGD